MNRTQKDSPMVVVDRKAWEDALGFFSFVAKGTYGGDDTFEGVLLNSANRWVKDHGAKHGIKEK